MLEAMNAVVVNAADKAVAFDDAKTTAALAERRSTPCAC